MILGGHRPMYVDSYLDEFPSAMVPVMKIMIKELEPLLWKYKVNLALWAHHHSYQRHAAIFESKVVLKSEQHTLVDENGEPINVAVYQNPQATVHMVLGTGGADFNIEDAGETTDLPFPNGDPNRTWYPWSEVFFYKYGYTRVTAINATHLDIKFTDSLNNIISDRALIIGLNNEPSSGHWVLSADQSGNYVGVLLAAVNTILLCTVAIHVFHSRSESML